MDSCLSSRKSESNEDSSEGGKVGTALVRPIKVLFLIADLSGGGAQRVLLTILDHLDRARFTPILVLSQRCGEFLDDVCADVPIHGLGRRNRWSFPGLVWRLARVLRRERPAVAFSLLVHSNLLLLLAKMCGLVPTTRVLLSEHISGKGYANDFVGRWLRRVLYPRSDKIVAVAEGVKADLVRDLWMDENRIEVIYNPVDIQRVLSLSGKGVEAHVDRGIPRIVMVGRLVNSQKGGDVLLYAFREIRDAMPAKLMFVGDGPDRIMLERMAHELGVSRDVVFTGFQKNPYRLIAVASVIVLSSYFEGFGCVIVEAMALGIPVVATSCPHGPSEIIDDGKSGLLVATGDYRALAKAVLRVLRDGELRERIVQQGRIRVEDFGVENIMRRYETLFRQHIRDL